MKKISIAGGGIAGLAGSIAGALSDYQVEVFEKADKFSEFGAGIQIGPHVVKILRQWQLDDELKKVAFKPNKIQVLNVNSEKSNDILSSLDLKKFEEKYNHPYLTIHRADLQNLLLKKAKEFSNIKLNLSEEVLKVKENEEKVLIQTKKKTLETDIFLLADGIWSKLRRQILNDRTKPKFTGHSAYRALIDINKVNLKWRKDINLWLGNNIHVVHYPVRAGKFLNIVVIMEGKIPQNIEDWNNQADKGLFQRELKSNYRDLQQLIFAVSEKEQLKNINKELQDLIFSPAEYNYEWRLWSLNGREPITSPYEMASNLTALLGDSAHPMFPYLAQGASMAIEDAWILQKVLSNKNYSIKTQLKEYANLRWQRNSKVQKVASRNGEILHLDGFMRFGRDLALRMFGEQLMSQDWLYRGV